MRYDQSRIAHTALSAHKLSSDFFVFFVVTFGGGVVRSDRPAELGVQPRRVSALSVLIIVVIRYDTAPRRQGD